MIEISLRRKGGRYSGFLSRGHAGYADEGEDIVCSAVSVLLINTVNSIEALTQDRFSVTEDDGYLELVMEETGEKSELLLASLALGLSSIEETYGASYLRVQTRE